VPDEPHGRRRGRPPIAPRDDSSVPITFRLSDRQYDAIALAAQQHRVSVSKYIRAVLAVAARRDR
jgi:predicted HicB family RNase H-like nuclease